jgi:CelD/BcsL family acetyltransferase involved in cellulose biosynthesis
VTGTATRSGTAPAPPAASAAAIRVVESATLGDRAAGWDELVAGAPLPSPFLRSWWLSSLDDSRRPHFVLVLDGTRLIGGLALQLRRRLGTDVFTMLGGGRLCPDHLDLVAAPDRRDDVVAALRAWYRRPGSRLLDLDGLYQDALIVDALAPALVTTTSVAPCEPLPGTPDEYFRARSRNFTRKVRKARRRLEAEGVVVGQVPAVDVPAALDDFAALHAVRRDRQSLLWHMDEIRRFVIAGVGRDEVRLYQAVRSGRRHAVFLTYTTGGRWSTYQLARSLEHDLRDVGTVMRAVALEEVCRAGFTELDCLRGDQAYKRSFTTRSRALLRVRAAHGARAAMLLAVVRGAERARHFVGTVLRSLRRAPSREQRS